MILPFELDPQIIHHIIYSQAGSIGKALIELIMNSVDANAKVVHLNVHHDGFSIQDDGNGFSSEHDVKRYFGRFGTPHVEGDATFGRFRLGRGQIMAHASTVWVTNHWQMTVDTKKTGYNYDLDTLAESKPGCSITGTWYERLDEREYLTTVQELRDLVRYTPTAVHLNGRIITRDPSVEKWDREDDHAYYRLQREGAVAIYNQGVLVRHDPGHFWGVGGVIVTKKAIALNVSRTEILRKTCPIWNVVAKQLKSLAASFVEKDDPRRKTENSRGLAAKVLLAGGAEILDVVSKEEVITLLPGGRHVTYWYLARQAARGLNISVVPSGADMAKAELIAAGGVAVLVHPKTTERFGCYDPFELEEVLERIRKEIVAHGGDHVRTRVYDWAASPLPFVSYDAIESTFVGRVEVLKDDVLIDKDLRRAWRSLRWALRQYAELIRGGELHHNGVCRRSGHGTGYWQEQIAVLLGASNVADAWTDGERYIAINVEQVRRLSKEGLAAASHIFSLVEHEMAHEGDSIDAIHDEAFFSRFHDNSTTLAARREWFIHKWLVKYLRSAQDEQARKKEYGWARNRLRLIERTNTVRRKDAADAAGLLDDVSASADLSESLPQDDAAALAFINVGLVERGVAPPPPDWSDLRRLSEEHRRRAQAQREAQRAEEADIEAEIEAHNQACAAAIRAVEKALGLPANTIPLHCADDFMLTVESAWPALWQALQEQEADAQEEARRDAEMDDAIASEGRAQMAAATGRDPATITDSEAWSFWHSSMYEDYQAGMASDTAPDYDPYLDENPALAEEFEHVNGRAPDDGSELSEWDDAARPRLQHGETMATLKRNAALVGLPTKEYLAWRAPQ